MKTLSEWYAAGCDFHDGMAFLEACGGNIAQFAPFSEQSFVPDMVQSFLKAALEPYWDVVLKQKQPENQTKTTNKIAFLKESAKPLHKRHDYLHLTLFHEDDPDIRLAMIRELMEVVLPKLDEIYDEIRSIEPHNNEIHTAIAQEEPIAPVRTYESGVKDAVEHYRRYINLSTRITKLGGKSGLIQKEPDAIRKAKLEQELQLKLVEKQTLMKLLSLEHENETG
jgi:hypothetical protein